MTQRNNVTRVNVKIDLCDNAGFTNAGASDVILPVNISRLINRFSPVYNVELNNMVQCLSLYCAKCSFFTFVGWQIMCQVFELHNSDGQWL